MTNVGLAPDSMKRALEAKTYREVRSALGFPRPLLTLPEVQRLDAHLAAMEGALPPVRIGLLRTYTTELLKPYWSLESSLAGFRLDAYEAPLGSLLQEGRAESGLRAHRPEATFLFLKWSDLDPRLLASGSLEDARERENTYAAAEKRLLDLVAPLREALPGLVVVTLLPRRALPAREASGPPPLEPGRERPWPERIGEALRKVPAVHFVDLDSVLAETAAGSPFDDRLWRVASFPFSVSGAQRVVRALFVPVWLLRGALTKCVVLDADNTLWGGIVGEDGLEGIALGPEPPGDAYGAFQEKLLEFRRRGILLALCSRNNPQDVADVLTRHPHQRLRPDDFAAVRVNWKSKVENLRSIASELNLGLESLLFVDDSPQECLLVERQIPELAVIRVPEAKAEIPTCLDGWPGLERLTRTDEDADRARYYLDARRRRDLEVRTETVDEYLAALRMVMTVGLDDLAAVTRIAQLTQKTNQFNLTTRRYTEAEIARSMRDPDWLVAHFSLADVCGDNGIVGAAIVRGASGARPEFDTFLLSCRVIGRGAESAFLDAVLGLLRERRAERVRGSYVPTPKNALVASFWSDHGFAETSPGLYERSLDADTTAPFAGPISVIISSKMRAPAGRQPA